MACCKIVTVDTIRNYRSRPAAYMSSIIALCASAADVNLQQRRALLHRARQSGKANRIGHNRDSARLPPVATGLSISRPHPAPTFDVPGLLDETWGRRWEKLRLLTLGERRKCRPRASIT